MHFQIFIDETGDHSEKATNSPQQRFLSVTGAIFRQAYHETAYAASFNAMREKHFGRVEGQLVHLHRREMVRCVGNFACLEHPDARRAWDQDFLTHIADSSFTLITTCLDKIAFYYHHPDWQDDPYHLCFFNALERFFYFLRNNGGTGEVIAEKRNPGRDRKLGNAYAQFWQEGTRHIPRQSIQHRFAGADLRMVDKRDDIPGVQLADLVGKPSFSACRIIYTGVDEFTPYSRMVARALWPGKYYSHNKRVDGVGRVWRPNPKR